MAAKEKTLSDAFYETLKDAYWAKKQAARSLGKSAKAAGDAGLKAAIEGHREEGAQQIERLEQVFEIVGKTARAKTCEAMKGIVDEMTEDLEEFEGTDAADAVLIGCLQAVEHYEIARYGTLKAWARQLGHEDAAKLLEDTTGEDKAFDAKLSELAEAQANAAGGRGEIEEDDDEDEEDEEAHGELEGSESDETSKGAAKPGRKAPARKKTEKA